MLFRIKNLDLHKKRKKTIKFHSFNGCLYVVYKINYYYQILFVLYRQYSEYKFHNILFCVFDICLSKYSYYTNLTTITYSRWASIQTGKSYVEVMCISINHHNCLPPKGIVQPQTSSILSIATARIYATIIILCTYLNICSLDAFALEK